MNAGDRAWAGGYAPPPAGPEGRRRSVLVTVLGPSSVLVPPLHVNHLGLSPERTARALREAAAVLTKVTRRLEGRQRSRHLELERVEIEPAPEGAPGLALDPGECRQVLRDLRALGAGLYGDLSAEMKRALARHHFPATDGREEPALTFQEGVRLPTPWELLYDGSQADRPDPNRFWGLRVPLTHWMFLPASQTIPVRNGLFSAITEDLSFPDAEVAELARQLAEHAGAAGHGTLGESLRRLVGEELARRPGGGAAEEWWAGKGGSSDWLRAFVGELASGGADGDDAEDWKRAALVRIFRDPAFRYGLIHFACHCEPSDRSELLSRLVMKVAGEAVCLDVSFMASDLARPHESCDEAGPLVFLNACASGRSGDAHEPPGFPEKWLNYGALAVVATLCEVPDYFAHEFARKFYELLFRGEGARRGHVAEALLAARRHFLEVHNNPLGLAYVLYAWEGARVLP